MIALITGASRGIGYETARGLLAQDVTVVIGARDETRGRKAAAELGAEFVALDVTSPESVAAAAAEVERVHGGLDILVNNAAILRMENNTVPSQVPLDDLRDTFETNVLGLVSVTNAMLPLLRASAAGRIVNLSSELGSMARMSDPDHPYYGFNLLAYNTSKAAVNMITVSYAKELADTPIRVNAVNPGYCATDLHGLPGPRTAAQGAAIAIALSLSPDAPTGTHQEDTGPVPW
ncbi:SDR family NAD(P)-dependent oxidoreductase [Actinocorallia sp. A-T 12471]|uniref:SDR family NAD(P)-dependent oxidoreductase n=1 Tax=Actinocorallia sp. A-T 12471 TaxID=3089813 RepID=UPI0029D2682B|nr:SDR family NAD(P)-dependent oxidoreductase [Actinocorallia sp. A-T 12471]MDX6741703.1 SDR family NAD(P)-dependent oxidoreductase [Actinocorallia sp. A-T 12471]